MDQCAHHTTTTPCSWPIATTNTFHHATPQPHPSRAVTATRHLLNVAAPPTTRRHCRQALASTRHTPFTRAATCPPLAHYLRALGPYSTDAITFLQEAESELLVSLVMSLDARVYPTAEVVPPTCMYMTSAPKASRPIFTSSSPPRVRTIAPPLLTTP